MKGTKTVLLPKLTKILEAMGENIKLARLRRKLTTEQIAERAGISRSTLWQVEKGLPSVALGTYAQVLLLILILNGFHRQPSKQFVPFREDE